MEWAELLPDDRRAMMALLNLDAQGLPLQPQPVVEPAATLQPIGTEGVEEGVASGLTTPQLPNNENTPTLRQETLVTHSQLKQGIASQVGLVFKHWKATRDLSRQYNHRVPKMEQCAVSVVSLLEGVRFKEFLVVLANVSCTLSIRRVQQAPKRRGRTEDGVNDNASENTLQHCSAIAGRDEHVLTFRTLHFVHRFKENVGYEVQSVWVPGKPLELQCVASNILQFALLMFMRAQYGAPPGPGASWDVARLTPPCHGDVVILGMGGNVMANCLVQLLPSTVRIRVVEIEPSVVAMCTMEGLLPDAPNFVTHIADVTHAVEQLDDASCALIVLDCFDPLSENMMHCQALLRLVRRKLSTGTLPSTGATEPTAALPPCSKEEGVLVVNVHQRPTLATLQLFVEVFGPQPCVEAIDIFGARQSVVACTRVPLVPPTPERFCALAATVDANAASVWRGDGGAAFRFTQNFVRAGRGVTPRSSSKQEGHTPFRVWDAADDTK